MKSGWIFLALFLTTACSSEKGWSESNKLAFRNTCVEENRVSIGADKVNEYCNCVQQQVQAKYPDYRDADKLTMSQNLDISNNCLPKGWSKEEKDIFMETCSDKRVEMGDQPEEARTYCDCMIRKIEVKYPDVTKAGSIPDEEMRALAQDCISNRR